MALSITSGVEQLELNIIIQSL
jgi:hypothetical protein